MTPLLPVVVGFYAILYIFSVPTSVERELLASTTPEYPADALNRAGSACCSSLISSVPPCVWDPTIELSSASSQTYALTLGYKNRSQLMPESSLWPLACSRHYSVSLEVRKIELAFRRGLMRSHDHIALCLRARMSYLLTRSWSIWNSPFRRFYQDVSKCTEVIFSCLLNDSILNDSIPNDVQKEPKPRPRLPVNAEFFGGASVTKLIEFSTLRDSLAVRNSDHLDCLSSARFRYVAHAHDVGRLQYPEPHFVFANLPLSDLFPMLTKTQCRSVASIHRIKSTARATPAQYADLAANHVCAACNSHMSVFSVEPGKQDLSRAKWQRRTQRKQDLLQEAELLPGINLAVGDDVACPPEPLDHKRAHSILSKACKKMRPESFEEAGCAVCGELKPLRDMSRLKSVKNMLNVLQAPGVTRKERKSEKERISEYTGPVLDYSCKNICTDCRVCIRNGKVPRLALANNLWIGDVPDELKCLRFVEKILIARVRHTCAYVKVASGMRKMKANVVAFESPIPKIYNILPPPRAELDDVLSILFTGPCAPTPEDFKRTPLLVRRNEVIRALEWLKLNHMDYADIEISASNMEEYDEHCPPVSIAYREAQTNKVPEGTSVHDVEEEDGTEEGQCPFTVHGLTGEALNTMPPSQLKATALRHLNNAGKMLAVGHSDQPESIYNNPQLYPQMFPWLFPYGHGGIGTTTLSEKEHKRHLLMYHDKRFQTDVNFPFVAFSHAQMKTSSTQGFLLVDQKRFDDISRRLMNADWAIMESISARMQEGEHVMPVSEKEKECFQIIRDLDVISGKMHGSCASKKYMRNEIWSLISRLGAPCWYITLSPADNRHPLCIYLAGSDEKFNPIPKPYIQRARMVANNPVAGARFFHFMMDTFVKDVLCFGSGDIGAFGKTNGYYGTVEQQGRLTLHLHLMLWIKGTLSPQETRDRITGGDSEFQRKIIEWLESCHTGDFLTGSKEEVVEKNKQAQQQPSYVDPTESLPKPPPALCNKHAESPLVTCSVCKKYAAWRSEYEDTVDDLLLRSNVHSCRRALNKDGSRKRTMASAGCMDNIWGKCKARFPRAVFLTTFVDKLGAIFMRKAEPWINTITPLVTYIFRCNTDVTSLASGTAIKEVTMYVSDYITKSTLKTHTIFDSVRAVFSKNTEMIGGSLPMKEKARRFMTKVVNLLSAKAEMGAPMICMYLLGNPDHYTSHIFVPFYWKSYVAEVRSALTAEPEAEKEVQRVTLIKKRGRIVGISPVHDYVHRPQELEDVSLYDWITSYERVKLSGRKTKAAADDADVEVDPDVSQEIAVDVRELDDIKTSNGSKALSFTADHPLHGSHGVRAVKDTRLRVANFIGGSLPRRDQGDREYYCSAMLTFFRPWRKGTDLLGASGMTWDDAFGGHTFTEEQELLMKNFHIRYECMDARDDYRAQLKKGAVADIFSSWDKDILDTEVNADPPAGVSSVDTDDVDATNLESSRFHIAKTLQMQAVRSMLTSLGWTQARTTEVTVEPVQPAKKLTGLLWEAEVEKAKQKVLAEKASNLKPNVAANHEVKKQMPVGSFVPNKVEIVDKSYLSKSYVHKDYSESVESAVQQFSLNKEQKRAFKIIANHSISENPGQLKMYLGGMGGTGKSQVLKALAHFFAQRGEAHRFVILAPTGTAAALLGGSTYHSFLGIHDYASDSQAGSIRARLTGVDYIFLDEVSMLSARDMYRIHNKLARILEIAEHPFGGMNMVFSGDFAQLPPAIGGEAVSLYSRTIGMIASKRKAQEEAIGKALWHQITTVVVLRQNMRQREQTDDDASLRTALENMRYKACTPDDIVFLRTRISSTMPGRSSLQDDEFRNVSIITGTNLHKDEINRLGAMRFAEETGQRLVDFYSVDSVKVNPTRAEQGKGAKFMSHMPENVQQAIWNQPPSFTSKHIPGKLTLCHGMPVMIRYNYATELCMTRGQEAWVVGWQGRKGNRGQDVLDTLFVQLKNPPTDVQVEGLPKNVVPVYATTHILHVTLPDGSKFHLQRKQVDVALNFAMTDFASQGKTRPWNVADINNLSSHQGYYTALSRSASAKGTLIVQGFDKRKITGGCSGALRQEFRELELLDAITELIHDDKLPENVSGSTRNELIRSFRDWKGYHYVPQNVHKAIRWTKKDPLEEFEVLDNWNDAAKDVLSMKEDSNDMASNDNLSTKRKALDDCDEAAEPAQPLTKKQHTMKNDIGEPAGRTRIDVPKAFRWQNNSCAYDSCFALMLFIWRSSPARWNMFSQSLTHPFVQLLFNGFAAVERHEMSLEDARDAVRHALHAHSPELVGFGEYTSLTRLFSCLFKTRETIMMREFTCGLGHPIPMEALRSLLVNTDIGAFATTSAWVTHPHPTEQYKVVCVGCGDTPVVKVHFVAAPSLLVLDWPGRDINADARITITVDGVLVEYFLRGVLYFGGSHFTAVVVREDGQLWGYDGMRCGGSMTYGGSLAASPPSLLEWEGRQAAAALYTRCA